MLDAGTARKRAALARSVRGYFDSMDFIEVETPARIDAPAPESHIDCPPVATGGFLRASPELQMKKLLAAGFGKIYQMGPCFRDGERGRRHNPEFTMLEWYRKGADWRDIARDLEGLVSRLGAEFGNARFAALPRRISVRDAYLRFTGWDPFAEWNRDRFDEDMALKIEPAVAAEGGGVFLWGYPPEAASLSLVSGGVAERWEFYFDGLELANCFTELCDGAEQARRFEAERAERARLGEADYPEDREFLAAVDAIGSAAGVALGIDRLAMSLFGADDISSVRFFA